MTQVIIFIHIVHVRVRIYACKTCFTKKCSLNEKKNRIIFSVQYTCFSSTTNPGLFFGNSGRTKFLSFLQQSSNLAIFSNNPKSLSSNSGRFSCNLGLLSGNKIFWAFWKFVPSFLAILWSWFWQSRTFF